MKAEKVLQTAAIAEFQYTVVVALCLDHFLHPDHVWTIDHGQENDFTAEAEHALLPVFWVAFSFLVNPAI